MPDFALNADIHLHRTRALVLGREQGDWKAHIASQKVPHKVWVRSFEIEWVERLVQLLEGDQPGSCIADGDIGATELLVNLKVCPPLMEWPAPGPGCYRRQSLG